MRPTWPLPNEGPGDYSVCNRPSPASRASPTSLHRAASNSLTGIRWMGNVLFRITVVCHGDPLEVAAFHCTGPLPGFNRARSTTTRHLPRRSDWSAAGQGGRVNRLTVLKECLPAVSMPPVRVLRPAGTTASRDKRKGMRREHKPATKRDVVTLLFNWYGTETGRAIHAQKSSQSIKASSLHQLMPHVDQRSTKRARRRRPGQEQAFLASYHVSKLQRFLHQQYQTLHL